MRWEGRCFPGPDASVLQAGSCWEVLCRSGAHDSVKMRGELKMAALHGPFCGRTCELLTQDGPRRLLLTGQCDPDGEAYLQPLHSMKG